MFERGASRELPELSILRACLLYLSRGWYTLSVRLYVLVSHRDL